MTTDSEIAKQLGISQSYFSKGYSWYRNNQRNNLGIMRNIPENMSSVPRIPPPAQAANQPTTQAEAPRPKLMLRLHRLQRSYLILNAISEQKLSGLRKLLLNNNHQWIGKGFRITSQNLELEGIELWSARSTPAAILDAVAKTISDNMAKSLSEQYGFLVDIDHPYSPPRLEEIELTEHALAEVERRKGIIMLYSDQEGYEVWMDKSFGLGGFESNRTEYIQKLTDFTTDLVENDSWNKLKAQAEIASSFAQQIELHLGVEQRNVETQAKIAEAVDRLTQAVAGIEAERARASEGWWKRIWGRRK